SSDLFTVDEAQADPLGLFEHTLLDLIEFDAVFHFGTGIADAVPERKARGERQTENSHFNFCVFQ
ncbi:MAG: hypothetical protein IKM54_03150, partial [Butyricicoccus sp.]|nr:hypothetical protein [Butyricicoccus sp.]